MYCYEEMIEGRKLTEIINTTHENVKWAHVMLLVHVIHLLTLVRYLPGRLLPENVVAIPDICEAARGDAPSHAVGLCSLTLQCRRSCICGLYICHQLIMFAGATILVVVTPHQFIGKQLPLLKSVIAPSCHAISLIKVRVQPTRALQSAFSFAHASQGIEFEGHNIRLISSIIR